MRKKLHEAQIKAAQMIDKIGQTNGTEAPASQDPIDAALHEMAIAKTISSIADKRYDAAKEHVLRSISSTAADDMVRLEAHVLKINSSIHHQLAAGKYYNLNVEIRMAGSKLDEKKLKVKLLTEGNLSSEQIDKIWSDCKVVNTPRRYYEVMDRGEDE